MLNDLTASRVRELFRYENDGTLRHRRPTGRKMKRGPLGAAAGVGGRLQTPVDGRNYYVHRLVWLWHHGEWPDGQIDHINGDVLDNRITNLRVATNTENCQNQVRRGVTFEARSGKWRARIMTSGKSVSLGYFDTEAEALAEYQRAKLVYHQPWATGRGAA